MRTDNYKPLLILFLALFPMLFFAQKSAQTLLDTNVNKNVEISLEASNVDIVIEEWNKNRVVVETAVEQKGLNAETANAILNAWDLKIKSTPQKISIKSKKSYNDFFMVSPPIPDLPPRPVLPDQSFIIADSLFFAPSMLVIPDEAFSFDFSADTITFDFEAFQNDSTYLKKWQKENEKRVKKALEAAKKAQKLSQKRLEELNARMAESRKKALEMEQRKAEAIAKRNEMRMKMHEKRAEELALKLNERENRINRILHKRSEMNVRKVIRIKIPKGARLEMELDNCKVIRN